MEDSFEVDKIHLRERLFWEDLWTKRGYRCDQELKPRSKVAAQRAVEQTLDDPVDEPTSQIMEESFEVDKRVPLESNF